MKIKCIRIITVCTILLTLCLGAVFQFGSTNKNHHANAVMVFWTQSH